MTIEMKICITKKEIEEKLRDDCSQMASFVEASKISGKSIEFLVKDMVDRAFDIAEHHDLDDGRETMIYVQSFLNGYLNCVLEQELISELLKKEMVNDIGGNIPPPSGREC